MNRFEIAKRKKEPPLNPPPNRRTPEPWKLETLKPGDVLELLRTGDVLELLRTEARVALLILTNNGKSKIRYRLGAENKDKIHWLLPEDNTYEETISKLLTYEAITYIGEYRPIWLKFLTWDFRNFYYDLRKQP